MRIIDTHIHVWDFDRAEYPWLNGDTSILNRTWYIQEIEEERKELGISNGILVQASCNLDDTALMLDVARETAWIDGVVCWLPLMDTAQTGQLLEDQFLKEKYFKGVRHLIHDEENPEWLLQPAVLESLALLAAHHIPYDVVGVLPAHIDTVLKVAEKIPTLRMVFDHLNAPPIPTLERFGVWGDKIKAAAQNKNFFAKISGLGTASGNFQGRTAEDIKPYVEFVLEQFGTERCLCGGDWPVSMLANSYTNTWKTTCSIITDLLPAAEATTVFSTTANHFYNLQLQ